MNTVPIYLINVVSITTLWLSLALLSRCGASERHSDYRSCGSASSQQSRCRGSSVYKDTSGTFLWRRCQLFHGIQPE